MMMKYWIISRHHWNEETMIDGSNPNHLLKFVKPDSAKFLKTHIFQNLSALFLVNLPPSIKITFSPPPFEQILRNFIFQVVLQKMFKTKHF